MTTSAYTPPPVPSDLPGAIRETKETLRRQIGDVTGAFEVVAAKMRAEVRELVELRAQGEEVWPVVQFADIAAGTVPEATKSLIRRRGCAIVKGTFEHERALEWDAELASYLDANDFFNVYRYLDDGFFGSVEQARPSIFPIYWSTPQVEARQDASMALTRQFLNSFWKHESLGTTWFDPNRDTFYPDRIRRRPPGTTNGGLSPHTDAGSVEKWLTPAYQRVFRHLFEGRPEEYDPWDGAYRSDVMEYQVPRRCSVFRTFQGWTALADMQPDQGVLHAIPIADAMSYQLLRALQDDVADDELCGATPGQTLPTTEKWHPDLWDGVSAIPPVEAGDTVWWHGDLIHAVAGVTEQRGWGNVMYIPASPWCDKNIEYARSCAVDLERGTSPRDFANEDYEVNWSGRATLATLNARGRDQLGLD